MREIVGSLGRIVGAAANARASVSMPRGSLGGLKWETARGVVGEGSLPVQEAAKERGGETGGGGRGEGEGREERAGRGRSSVNNAATGYANTPTRPAPLSSPVLRASRNDQGAMTLSPGHTHTHTHTHTGEHR
jgi:hypothetical protein